MFEIELTKDGEIGITTKSTTIKVNVAQSSISAGLGVGAIKGPGEFEIGEASIVGVKVGGEKGKKGEGDEEAATIAGAGEKGQTIYGVEIGGIRIGIIGGVEGEVEDELGPIDILVTSSIKATKTIEPKIVIISDNYEAFATELKAEIKSEKKLKIKNEASLPVAMEVYRLSA